MTDGEGAVNMPEVLNGLLGGDPARAARGFATTHGLPQERQAPGAAVVDAEAVRALVDALREGRPADAEWWTLVAELWLALGMAGMAISCTLRARQLINQGAPAVPDLVRRLSGTDRSARAALVATAPSADATPVSPGPEAAYTKYVRMLEHRERGRFQIDAELKRRWQREGQHRLIVESLLAHAATNRLDFWLFYSGTEELVRCGRALHTLGDRISAYACFSLVVSVHGEPMSDPDEHPDDPHLRYAYAYLSRSPGLADRLGDPSPPGHRIRGAALLEWLEREGLQAELLTGPYVHELSAGPMRGRLRTLRRQVEGIAQRNGWFLPLIEEELLPPGPYATDAMTPVTAAAPPPSAALPGGARRVRGAVRAGVGAAARFGCSAPESLAGDLPTITPANLPETLSPDMRRLLTELFAAPSAPALLRTVVGIGPDGGDRILEIAPGSPAVLLGTAGEVDMTGHIAAELVASGIPVLWACPPGPEGSAHRVTDGWHRLRDGGHWGRRAGSWVSEFKHADTRAAVLDCLISGAAPCPDPAGDDCLSGLLDAVCGDQGAEDLADGGRQSLRRLAARVVEARAHIDYSGPAALRRIALLLERTTRAAESLREAISMSWSDPPVPMPNAPSAVVLELPVDDPTAAAVALTLVIGSLLRTADAVRDVDAVPGAATDVWPEGFDLKVRPRGAEERTDETGADSAGPSVTPAPVSGLDDQDYYFGTFGTGPTVRAELASAWTEHGMVHPHCWQPLCVLVSANLATVPVRLLERFGGDGAAHEHGLIVASPFVSPAELRTATRYSTFLVGRSVERHDELRTAFEVGAGVRLPSPADTRDADACLVRCAGPDGTRCDPLVLWPRISTGGGE
ncbi:hypothetical protein AB0E85_23980 [Streptomyces sp. NPDC029044]|uniref:hypothetical protein n=1 Tax=Streptomyces sp. NPDC029044 TaxID=3157198 RepID=UPI0033EA9DE8